MMGEGTLGVISFMFSCILPYDILEAYFHNHALNIGGRQFLVHEVHVIEDCMEVSKRGLPIGQK